MTLSSDGNTLTVTYIAGEYAPGEKFEFNDLHLWVGCTLGEFCEVVNSGDNTPPGQFPYQYQVVDNFFTKSFTVDVSDCNGSIFVSAHGGEAIAPEEVFE